MAGIIDYLEWRGDLDFTQSPLNPVDSLILSEMSYLKFDDLLAVQPGLTLRTLTARYFEKNTGTELGVLLTGDFRKMIELMSESNRYGDLVIRDAVDVYDEKMETQFAVTLIELNEKTAYIAFRGTDDTLIGWKEDFQMSFMDTVPAQKMALDYVNNAVSRLRYKNVYIGGHSKGGNLAVYAAVHADKKVKSKIISVFNNDGPGFKTNILKTSEYQEISDRITTLVPQSSVVGMLLEHEESYHVVRSRQRGLLQHDGFSWEVMGADFVYLSRVADDCIAIDKTMKEFLNTLNEEQRKDFTNTIFEIISVNENRTLTELKKDGLKTLFSMSQNYINLDKETKKVVAELTAMFFGKGFQNFLEVKNVDQWREKLLSVRRERRVLER